MVIRWWLLGHCWVVAKELLGGCRMAVGRFPGDGRAVAGWLPGGCNVGGRCEPCACKATAMLLLGEC